MLAARGVLDQYDEVDHRKGTRCQRNRVQSAGEGILHIYHSKEGEGEDVKSRVIADTNIFPIFVEEDMSNFEIILQAAEHSLFKSTIKEISKRTIKEISNRGARGVLY